LFIYRFQGAHKHLNSTLLRVMFAVIACLIAIAAFILMAYLLVFGAIVAVILYVIMMVKNKFPRHIKRNSQQGRIIDVKSHDWYNAPEVETCQQGHPEEK